MKGDFSRLTFDPKKNYNRVLMQQGRVQLDADWNEQQAIADHRLAAQVVDVVGPQGTPKGADGFTLERLGEGDFVIHPGRIYVGGQLCELAPGTPVAIAPPPGEGADKKAVVAGTVDGRAFAAGQWVEFLDEKGQSIDGDAPRLQIKSVTGQSVLAFGKTVPGGATYLRRLVTYLTQPYLPAPKQPDQNTTYLAYLDAWERAVTALEDPEMREVALGGPDTAIRSQVVWQIKLHETEQGSCQEAFEAFLGEKEPPGRMAARRSVPSATILQNQLYRVEIHQEGQTGFKWARDNASVVARAGNLDPENKRITIRDQGRNTVSGFEGCPWVELTDEWRTLAGQSGFMLEVEKVDGATLTLKDRNWPANLDKETRTVRRWQGYSPALPDLAKNDGYAPLEDGIEVRFPDGPPATYSPGDYWLIPARSEAPGGIEWPPGNRRQPAPLPQPPLGIAHAYCPLALVTDGEVTDGRPEFANLTTGLLSQSGGTLRGQLKIDQPREKETDQVSDLVTTGSVQVAAQESLTTPPQDSQLSVNGPLWAGEEIGNNGVKSGVFKPKGLHTRIAGVVLSGVEGKGQGPDYEPPPTPTIILSTHSQNTEGARIEYKENKVNIWSLSPDQAMTLCVGGKKVQVEEKESSDVRLKRNVRPIGDALDTLGRLDGVQFEWRSDEFPEKRLPTGPAIGVIAQDVEKAVPEVVSTDGDGFKTVDYGRLVALLIEAVKSLKAETDALRHRVAALESSHSSGG
jgi:hypothetical protein